jgi:DNA-binding NtrC family response regulator
MTAAIVLLIEEHAPLRLLYQQTLEDEGYRVVAVGNCEEALDLIHTISPDVIVLEPVNNDATIEAWSLLMQVTDFPPVIWNTGRFDYRDKAQDADVNFVLKSSDVSELCQKVRHVLDENRRVPFHSPRAAREQLDPSLWLTLISIFSKEMMNHEEAKAERFYVN